MDRVRFGRALGAGAREAAKAVMKAADAAAAPNPAAPNPTPTSPAARPTTAVTRATGVRTAVAGRIVQAKATSAGVTRGSKRFGQAMWAPLVKAGGVLWLEVTGVLFGMFAAAAGIGVWHERGNFNASGAPLHRAWFAVGMLLVFGYFTVSSYVRAAKQGKR